ncbi:MAG: CYTH domain-containing protein [Gammaproteobacteria bacterium]
MAIEIERKFLVADDGWREAASDTGEHYQQGYLAFTEHAVIRVRLADDGRAWIGVKEHRIGISRGEYEYAIPTADARELLALAQGTPIEKRRYRVPYSGHVWEVDEFLGANAGLVVAEIELKTVDASFEHPPWLGREVTAERRYYNAALALEPWRNWDEREGNLA